MTVVFFSRPGANGDVEEIGRVSDGEISGDGAFTSMLESLDVDVTDEDELVARFDSPYLWAEVLSE